LVTKKHEEGYIKEKHDEFYLFVHLVMRKEAKKVNSYSIYINILQYLGTD